MNAVPTIYLISYSFNHPSRTYSTLYPLYISYHQSTKMSGQQSPQQPDFSSSTNPLKKFKLVFLGEQSVGKTSLITRFVRLYLCVMLMVDV
jgi:hypothetical protein